MENQTQTTTEKRRPMSPAAKRAAVVGTGFFLFMSFLTIWWVHTANMDAGGTATFGMVTEMYFYGFFSHISLGLLPGAHPWHPLLVNMFWVNLGFTFFVMMIRGFREHRKNRVYFDA